MSSFIDEVLLYLERHGEADTVEIARHLGMDSKQVYKRLRRKTVFLESRRVYQESCGTSRIVWRKAQS